MHESLVMGSNILDSSCAFSLCVCEAQHLTSGQEDTTTYEHTLPTSLDLQMWVMLTSTLLLELQGDSSHRVKSKWRETPECTQLRGEQPSHTWRHFWFSSWPNPERANDEQSTLYSFTSKHFHSLDVKSLYTFIFCGYAYCTGVCIFPNYWLFVLPHQTCTLDTIPVS